MLCEATLAIVVSLMSKTALTVAVDFIQDATFKITDSFGSSGVALDSLRDNKLNTNYESMSCSSP